MKALNTRHRSFFAFLVVPLLLSVAISCRKDPPVATEDDNSLQTPTTDRTALTNDSIFLYAKAIYYWNENLPTYNTFNPRQYTTGSNSLERYERNLFAIAGYSTSGYDLITINGYTYTKFSYIEDSNGLSIGTNVGIKSRIAGVNLEGIGNDIGIFFVSALGTETDYTLYIVAVYDNSPADREGLTRGATITHINGTAIGSNFDNEVGVINNSLLNDPSSVTLRGQRTDGTTYEATLNKTVYESSPIYDSRIIDRGSKKIGYLAYARFSTEQNSIPKLDSIFNVFAGQGVTDLVIDLRYNGGGYVTTADHFINLIAPTTATGIMYTEYYNQAMQDGEVDILENQPMRDGTGNIIPNAGTYADINYSPEVQRTTFNKQGSLGGVTNVVFLVTNETASASELVINALRPVMNVSLVGTTTFGKPIGYFPILLENRYNVYYALYSARNAEDQGNYYQGFTPGTGIAGVNMRSGSSDRDYADHDFGDEQDLYLREALNILAPSTSALSSSGQLMSARSRASLAEPRQVAKLGTHKEFKGMIENRVKR